MRAARLLCLGLAMSVLGHAAAEAVPVTMRHQGRFIVGEGFPLQDEHQITVSLWDEASGGNLVWSETYTVQLTDGYYAVTMGLDAGNALDSAILERFPLYLGLSLDGGAEFSPRQEVVSVPYAVLSDVSESVIGGHADVNHVDINGNPVIDSSGNWVGPAIYDGSDFALSGQTCGADQLVAGISTTGTLQCLPVADREYVAGDGLALTGNVFSADFAGAGAATTVARSDHDHDGAYLPQGSATSCPAGSHMIGIEAATGDAVCAPNQDANTTYSAGAGLALSGTTFSVVFDGGGTAETAARSDHDHNGSYLPVGGTTECPPGSRVTGIDPATGDVSCAADTDTDTTYAAGVGLTLSGTTFHVVFDGSGSAGSAARSDHDHNGRYLPVGTDTACAPGQKATGLDPSTGNVLCAADIDTDTNTTYSAGPGLILSGTQFRVEFGAGGSQDVAVRYDDPRLADARPPSPGSNDYIQNQFAADQPANLRISGQGMFGSTLHVQNALMTMRGLNALQGTDAWLRLNQQSQFSAGVYTPTRFRTDGELEVYGPAHLYHCRLCFYYADRGGASGKKTMCVKFTPGSFTGMMSLAGDVDDNDVVGMKYLCDNGPAGIHNGWPWQ